MEKTESPPAWGKKLWDLDTDTPNNSNNALLNEDLIVWMRTAAFPNFRKLYRKIDQKLEKGTYKLLIDYSKSDIFVNNIRKIGLTMTCQNLVQLCIDAWLKERWKINVLITRV